MHSDVWPFGTDRNQEQRCPVCESESAQIVLMEMMFGTHDPFRYRRCFGCGMLWIQEQIDDLSPYYPHNYYSFESVSLQDSTTILTRARRLLGRWRIRNAISPTRYGAIMADLFPPVERLSLSALRMVDMKKVSSILDVGSGKGRFLAQLARLNRFSLVGIDPFLPTAIRYNDNFRVENVDVFSISGKFDLITMNHSLEHMTNHPAVFQQLRQLVAPQGRVLIRVPVSSDYIWGQYHIHWAQLDAPRHQIIHTQSSIAIIARESGFELESVVFDSNEFQFTASENYLRNQPLVNESPASQPIPQDGSRELPNRRRAKRRLRRKIELVNRYRVGDQAIFCLSPA